MTSAVTCLHPSGESVRTLCEAFALTTRLDPAAVALRTPGDAQTITWQQYAERVHKIAAGFAALGVGRGDTVALMLTNRPEFHLVDTAALHLGAIPFSIYNTSSPEQINYLFGNAENRVVVTEQQFLPRIEAAGTAVEHIICVDGGTRTLADLEAAGDPDFDLAASASAVEPGDVATLIYTSGTTGPPKGVEITHANLMAEAVALLKFAEAGPADRVISYLPAAHIADRVTAHYTNLARGAQITCVSDPRAIAAALPDARPSVLFGVPRVWQKVKAGIEARIAAEPSAAKRRLATWAIDVGQRVSKARLAGQNVPVLQSLQHRLADRLVLGKLRHALGMDRMRWAASGAAAIPPETLEFFLGIGVPVYEVWGMSETTGAATANTPSAMRIGTVGKAMLGVELKLADDGELLCRGPLNMRGYRKDPERTADAVDADGWLHTGDIATIDADGYVAIVDRKKELIISEGGKNMSPTNIENAIKAASPLIGQAIAIGDARPYITALIILDPDVAATVATDTSAAALAESPKIRAAVQAAVSTGNARLSRAEQIKRFRILPDQWEPGGDELTPTMKLKRRPIADKYASEIDDLYAPTPGPGVVTP